MSDEIAFKILTNDQWQEFEREGIFTGAPVDLADGYIHLSTQSQLAETMAKHFAGQSDLVIVAIRLADYGDAVRWEKSRNDQLFPHVYGSLRLDTVISHKERD